MPLQKPISEEELKEEREEKLQEKLKSLREKELEREAVSKSNIFQLPYISLKGFPIDLEALSLIPKEMAQSAQIIVFSKKNEELQAGIVNPGNPELKKAVEKLKSEGFLCSFFIISQASLNYALNFYRQIIRPKQGIKKVEIGKEALVLAAEKIKNLAELNQKIRQISLSESISLILAGAAKAGASDIHLEPEEKKFFLRYRLDGVLQIVAEMPIDLFPKILSRIKFLAGIKINITDVPQDGRFTISLKDKEIDLRISTLPTPYGESVVMRLLGIGAYGLTLDKLGLRRREGKILEKEIQKPNGLILTTGPTGSGKTTTLYALINKKKSPKIKIITLEDPVEYRIEGITQTQLNPEVKMDFARGLRAILRQNPDVVMVGEIRDLETAEVACQAAQTGHLVFSTLHTNDATGVIPRLMTIGARPYIIAPALRVVIAQRLVRRLCLFCRTEYQPDKNEIEKFKKELSKFFPKKEIKKLYKAKGCKRCHMSGFSGRVGIYEVFENNEKMEQLISQRAPVQEISKAAKDQGMMTMRQDGFLKVIEGITSLDELNRVA
ncbi:MAG: GspE/PulE family protein [Patescibacteria group bacterium]